MKSLKYILASVLCLFMSTACSGNQKEVATQAESDNQPQPGKTLVIFFSHAGDNYSVGDIKVGNTKIVADYVSEIIGADQFEIKTNKYDGMEYHALTELVKEEKENGVHPDYEGDIDNLDQYDTIFIGGPIWWGTYPEVMFTFFSKHDLNGKTLIPFTTHEGSGLGSAVKDLKKVYPKATVKGEFSIYGHEARDGKAKVEKWLKDIGF